MNGLLHPDHPVICFLSRLFDLILLNILFIVSCIPILTIGAALSATYQVLFKLIDKKDPSIVKCYWKAFKENFMRATSLWIFIVSAGIGINAALFAIYNRLDPKYELLQIPVCMLVFILLSVAVYAFPLLSRYQCGMKQLLKNTFMISIANIPATVMIAVFPLGLLYIAYVSNIHLATVCSLASTIGCSGILYIVSYVLLSIFKKYESRNI